MTDLKKAKVTEANGMQVVVLPKGIHLDGDEVYVSQDDATGNLVLSLESHHNPMRDYLAYRDSLDIPQEDLDAYMAERPMNRLATFRNVFEDEE